MAQAARLEHALVRFEVGASIMEAIASKGRKHSFVAYEARDAVGLSTFQHYRKNSRKSVRWVVGCVGS